MSEPVIRDYAAGDIPAMAQLWARCFEEPRDTAESFIRALPDFGGAVTAEKDGRIVGAAYALTGMELLGSGAKKPPICGYIYAVAVDKEHRGRGVGGALVQAAAELARRREADIICVEPAAPELFGWYEKLLGVKWVLSRSERRLKAAETELTMPLSSTEYMLWREKLLAGRPHIHHSNHSLEAQRRLLSGWGGGFFAAESGIAAACTEGDTAVISELLCSDPSQEESAAAAVGAALGCGEVLLKSSGGGQPYMAADRDFPENCVWNLSFD